MKNSYLETIKVVDGKLFHMPYHQKRYESVLSMFGITEYQNLSDVLDPPQNGIYKCSLTYSKLTPQIIKIKYNQYEKRNIKSLKIVYDDNIVYSHKSADREELDRLYKLREDCDDILIVKNSFVTDSSIANVAFFDGKTWFTPKNPLLKGTTRERYLEDKKIVEADIKVDDIKNFSAVALLNAMIDFDIITNLNIKY
ncbi:aminotransferase class IV family protein [Sulfurimonas sp.]